MKAYQRTLEGGVAVATGNRIKDQLAGIMEDDSECQRDEDLLAARWLQQHAGFSDLLVQSLSRWCGPDGDVALLGDAIRAYRKADIRRRRQEMAADGSYPWPTDEAERRQKRARGGAPR